MMSTIFLCILVFTLSSAEATSHNLLQNPKSGFLKKQAEEIIRGLNLFPERDINIVENDPAINAPRIVEKSFQFPYITDSVTASSNGSSLQDFGHHAGYYRLPHTKDARMFYYFFESRNNNVNDPVVVWLTGGPGCSGSLALFYENGPFHLTNNLSLEWSHFGWDKVSNLIYVDQPTGTGFSYSSSEDDIRKTSEEAGLDFYDFLQSFFEKHPQYAKNDFYITGESYAGHYIPAFATQIQQKNKKKEGIHINLKGIAIGNGLTNTGIQYKAYPDFALQMKLVNSSQYNHLKELASTCEQELNDCNAHDATVCDEAYSTCLNVVLEIREANNGINIYDIRKKCEGFLCYDFSKMEKFLNQISVRKALGVGDIEFVSCSTAVHEAMELDILENSEVFIPGLLQDGIKLLVYAGEYDLICNWLGNWRWVNAMEWSGRKEFVSAPSFPFIVDGVKAGLGKSYGGLTFLKVYNAGHMVPMDQPKASLKMLGRWIRNKQL